MTSKDQDLSLDKAPKKYLKKFFRCNKFTTDLAPFSYRQHGPEWFTRTFPPTNALQLSESKAIWQAFLTPRLIVTRLHFEKGVKLVSYQPNLVAREFGLCQPLPCCFYKSIDDIVLGKANFSEEEPTNLLTCFANDAPIKNLLGLDPLFYTIKELYDWWTMIYTTPYGSIKPFKKLLAPTFVALKEQFQRGTG